MQTTDLDVAETVEQIRKKVHPDLDARFLKAVVKAERDNPEDDAAAISAIDTALRLALSSTGSA